MALKIAERWFERRRVDDDITLLWEPHVIPLMRCNIWHVRGRDRDLFIDTGMGVMSLREAARDLLDKPVTAVATHTHGDHTGGHHEFDDCLVHRAEQEILENANREDTLDSRDFGAEAVGYLIQAGYELTDDGAMITALPSADYDPATYRLLPAKATRVVEDGDIVDIGDRHFEILHLPGHSPGSIGLWEAAHGILFSGDCLYDGPLLDGLPESDLAAYRTSMERLRELPVRIVHAGHDPSFGRVRMIELIDTYLAKQQS